MTIKKDSIPENVIKLIKDINNSGYEAYIVGGCVRDLILKREPHDYDICTNAKPNEVFNILKDLNYRFHTIGIEFGTITALIDDEEYEITTYRKESTYSDNRHPDKVEFVTDINEDLKRRDFTINAIAYNPITEEFIDNFSGIEDIQNKLIKTVGNADDRFKEDALRILRALRFAIVLNFNIEKNTFNSMITNNNMLNDIAKERITDELRKILTSDMDIRYWFREAYQIILTIIPELKNSYNCNQQNKYHMHNVYEHMLTVTDYCNTPDFEIKLAALLHDIGKPETAVLGDDGFMHYYGHPKISRDIASKLLVDRLRLTTAEYYSILNLIENHDMNVGNSRASVKRVLNKHGELFFRKWLLLKRADVNDHINYRHLYKIYKLDEIERILNEVIAENSCYHLKDLEISGTQLMNELNIKPGKLVGTILQILLDEVIQETLENKQDKLLERAHQIYEESQIS